MIFAVRAIKIMTPISIFTIFLVWNYYDVYDLVLNNRYGDNICEYNVNYFMSVNILWITTNVVFYFIIIFFLRSNSIISIIFISYLSFNISGVVAYWVIC